MAQVRFRTEGEVREQTEVAEEVRSALQAGQTAGQVFDRLRPRMLEQRRPEGRFGTANFAAMVIHQLMHQTDEEVLAWLEPYSKAPTIQLRSA